MEKVKALQSLVRRSDVVVAEDKHVERERIYALFQRIDSDNDGAISLKELQEELERLQLPFTAAQLHDILNKGKDGLLVPETII
jgi:Ca2+-binding EF-hand superfamily protein